MSRFRNPKNLSIPTQEETLKLIEEYKALEEKERELEDQMHELEKKHQSVKDNKERVKEKIHVYNVDIKIYGYYLLFTSLKEAEEMRDKLTEKGISRTEMRIELINDWVDVESIDGQKHSYYKDSYDTEEIYKEFKKRKRQFADDSDDE